MSNSIVDRRRHDGVTIGAAGTTISLRRRVPSEELSMQDLTYTGEAKR